MIKHRLMLSAAAAATVAAAVAFSSARADTEISTSTSTALSTSTSGNITIDSGGGVGIGTASVGAVTINSNNSVLNNGTISNANTDSAIGVVIDTTAGNIFSSSGFASSGAIDVGGNGTTKRGIMIEGGNTFFGNVNLSSLQATSLTGATAITQQSSIVVQGDVSAAFYLVQGTQVTGDVYLGGGGIIQNASANSTESDSIVVDLDGTLNGTFFNAGSISAVGPGIVGIEELGGIHSCASVSGAPDGFSCPTSSSGAFVNAGSISVIGTAAINSRGGNAEAGSGVIIAGPIDGGFLNNGPGTSSSQAVAVISSAGLIASGVTQPTVLIDPSRSITGTATVPRGSVIIGPVLPDTDAIDPGYAFINRGSITATPIDNNLSTAALMIQGASSTYVTCLSSVSGSCDLNPHNGLSEDVVTNSGSSTVTNTVNYNAVGGLLNTGTISAHAVTGSQTVPTTGIVSATALYFGAYARSPSITVKSEAVSGSTNTAGTITAQVSGVGQGSAFAVILGANSDVPAINVGQNASIIASVTTSTLSPTRDFATETSPFSLVSEAILDQSGTLKAITNAGTIQAVNTTLTPDTGAVVSTIQRAIDLSAGTTGGATISNSGRILGDVLFGAAGNGNEFDVGNTGSGGTTANASGVINTVGNYAVVAGSVVQNIAGQPPLTQFGTIDFGSGVGNILHVGGFGYVNAAINSAPGGLDVTVDPNGQLFVANTTSSLQARNIDVGANGTLGLAISQTNLNSLTPVVQASNEATLTGATIGLQFGTYISSGFTAASVANPTAQTISLVRAPVIIDTDASLAQQNAVLGQNTPFLFETPAESGLTPLTRVNDSGGQQTLQLHLLPRSVNAKNADGSPGLNLSGDAKSEFPFTAAALATDDELGAAVATSMTVYNTPGVASSGINYAASQQQAQKVFSQFSPDVSGATREIAIMLTDQATGPVAARQRLLRSFSDEPGDMTLWGEEFIGHINNKGAVSASNTITAYKDHGFGFSLGVDGGSSRNGWYGGAFTFYTGDATQELPRSTRTNTQWYMLTGYTDWKGKHVFLDTHLDVAYGDFNETRSIDVGGVSRIATSKRPGEMVALGANTGVMMRWKGIEFDPHVSLDGLTLREEGYSEANGGPGFNLDVQSYYASSVRGAVGTDIKGSVTIWDFALTPEARIGYRYDMLQQPVKVKAAFDSTGGLGTAGNVMTFTGPDPDKGNTVLGLSLGANTDTWQLGVNYDWVRGDNGSTTQVGTLTVLGRI